MSVTFTGSNVLSNQLANKTGNLSQLLFRQNEAMSRKKSTVKSLNSVLDETNPLRWNSINPPDQEQGEDERFNIYMSQARMSTHFQDHPWTTLKHSKEHGYQGPQLGGQVRGNIPPGYLPGNTLTKPNKDVRMQKRTANTIEGFENVSSEIIWN